MIPPDRITELLEKPAFRWLESLSRRHPSNYAIATLLANWGEP